MDSLNQNKNKQGEQDSQNYFLFDAEEEGDLNLEGEINGLEEEKYLFTKKDKDSSPKEEDVASQKEVEPTTSEDRQEGGVATKEEEVLEEKEETLEREDNTPEENTDSDQESVTSIGDILKSSSWFNSSEQTEQEEQAEDISEGPLSEPSLSQEPHSELQEEEVAGEVSETPESEKETPSQEETISFPRSKVALMKKLLKNVQDNNEKLLQMFEGLAEEEDIQLSEEKQEEEEQEENAENIIEGVFDGENMIGPDGRQYSVPTNYASKSKLVEGDILKLTITENGKFLYKQIHPISRARVIGTLKRGSDGNYYVVKEDKKWKVLQASITYFKGDIGDEVSLLIPAEGDSKWGAIENIVKQ